MEHEKIWRDFVDEQNGEWSEKRVFLFISLFSREREIEVKKNSVSERNFFFTCGIFKHFLNLFLVKRFGYDVVLL